MRVPILLLSLLLVLCACAATGADPRSYWVDRWPALAAAPDEDALELRIFRARRPDPQQSARLDAAIRVYIQDGDEAFAPLRAALAADPVTAFWLARTLGVFALQAFARAGEARLLVEGKSPWQRPLDQLAAMGEAAVPFVFLDLLEHSLGEQRDFGVRVLTYMGPSAFPAWSFVFAEGSLRTRRLAMRALLSMTPDESAIAVLEQALSDTDFGIRAGAYRGLAKAGASQASRLREALGSEKDPFVRRAILDSMVRFKDRATALAVLSFYRECLEAGEYGDLRRADSVLQKISGLKGGKDLRGWQAWIQTGFEPR